MTNYFDEKEFDIISKDFMWIPYKGRQILKEFVNEEISRNVKEVLERLTMDDSTLDWDEDMKELRRRIQQEKQRYGIEEGK